MRAALRLNRIQGNVVPGFRTNHQAFLCVNFSTKGDARGWLGTLVPAIASAARIMTEALKRRGAGYTAGESGGAGTAWLNVAFSWAGLDQLGPSGLAEFPTAFASGMAARAPMLNDPDPASWLVGGSAAPEVHALLLVAADTRARLEAEVAEERRRLDRYGLVDLLASHRAGDLCRGETLPGRLRAHEHFGFRDGVSQPDVLGSSDGTMPGDFILGYPGEDGTSTVRGPDWAHDGSYLVFRRLRQDVFGFRRALRAGAEATGLTAEQFGASIMGRWKSGARIGDRLEPWDPGFPAKAGEAQYDDGFLSDPSALRVPRFAHVRKAYPRDVKGAERHRIIRRGIPYGPLLPERARSDDGVDRGILFVAYQADIEAQFEHIQKRLNDPAFPRPGTGSDPLAGQTGNSHQMVTLPEAGGGRAAPVSFRSYVSMTGGGYFFSPSIPALAHLADPTIPWTERKDVMEPIPDVLCRLGQFIANENPYPWPLALPENFDDAGSPHVYRAGLGKLNSQEMPFRVVQLPQDDPRYAQGLFWSLGGDRAYRMSKAIRIEYDYAYPDGTTKTYAIVIGFEGGGGGM
jgi:Dyp-type peroxidase family